MTQITLQNTQTRQKEVLEPIKSGEVSMYVCGPTVYDRAHLGNARPVIIFDTLFRLLRHVYGEDKVTYVRNFTDVDDKINARAAQTGQSIREITDGTIGLYLDDMDAVGAMHPTHMPRATEYIQPMVDMSADLIEKGFAYEAKGHVLFAVESYADYGKFSGRSIDDMIAGSRVEVAPYKRNPMDFVLWKPSDADTPGWDSPWGKGRPGWHIECSAMAHELLGESFDIHGGGNDLMFPHHENEIAQSKCVGHEFANIWIHNEMLQVEGKKMSKSLGNFFTVRDLLDQGVPGEVIRFVMLSTHYRKPMDWTETKRAEAERTLRGWHAKIEGVTAADAPNADVIEALADDLNTHKAIQALHDIARNGDPAVLKRSAQLLGLLSDEMDDWVAPSFGGGLDHEKIMDVESWLRSARNAAKLSGDFSEVDRLRSDARDAGLEVQMGKDTVELKPTSAFDADRLHSIKRGEA
ncbi:cysteinyl-tRNA synthetase [Planktotalea frisia]|uniref:Cysteine--tRNA ligase n=1 Tax=Planktotalea frisia TaxID=696762 RepID=A0A1L9NYS8_9RHOB|nr:cysteine--tRNA ligase [Planktotalea frisia]OJI94435.1 cysteine--tRNA ligase [Planktotalea frisia]PZX30059.1 cysteinyl-tRNA synthetase [Planktotalea frisia]